MKLWLWSFPLLLAGMAAIAPAVHAEGSDTTSDGGGEYIVKSGDTLWDISGSQLKDPYRWKDIWKENQDIKDPNRINPGEKIILPGGGGESGGGRSLPSREASSGGSRVPMVDPVDAPFVERGKTINKRSEKKVKESIIAKIESRRIPVATEDALVSAGFISDESKLKPVAEIVRDVREMDKTYFANDDEVFVRSFENLKIGDSLQSVQSLGEIKSVKTDDTIGVRVRVLGILEVTDKKDELYICKVRQSFFGVRTQDPLIRYHKVATVYEPAPPNPAAAGKYGYVIGMLLDRSVSGTDDIVYIDLGAASGIKPGDKLNVTRTNGSYDSGKQNFFRRMMGNDTNTPEMQVGVAEIISVGDKASVAKLVEFTEVIKEGYRVSYGQ